MEQKRRQTKGQGTHTHTHSYISSGQFLSNALLLTLTFISSYGCTGYDCNGQPDLPEAGLTDTVGNGSGTERIIPLELDGYGTSGLIDGIDVFSYCGKHGEPLDAYQRYDRDSALNVISSTGSRKILVLANNRGEEYLWEDICTYKEMQRYRIKMENDDPGHPCMSGEGKNLKDGAIEVRLQPIMSEVCLRSLSCRFTGGKLKGKRLEDVKVYLTNVNSDYAPFDEEDQSPHTYLNFRGAVQKDLDTMDHPEMVYREIREAVGSDTKWTPVTFHCYPNTISKEGPGAAFTRLVIEGTAAGKRWFYPISINRSENGLTDLPADGIRRNRRYVYDIIIKNTGTMDPDTDISPIHAEIHSMTTDWEERDEEEIIF